MQRRTAFFGTCPGGLGRMLRDRLGSMAGVEVTGTGTDGQSDYVLFDADSGGRAAAIALRLAEAVFATASRASRDGATDPRALASRCWRPESTQRALSVWAEQVRPLRAAMAFRVGTRMQTGPSSLRAGLRGAVVDVIRSDRPKWLPDGRGELIVWVGEYRDGELITGLRLGGNSPVADQHPAAPPPAVAAAMVALAGQPGGVLLDPCCGTGVVLAEALAAGWTAEGTDADLADTARMLVPGATVREGHPHEILEPDGGVSACVSRLRSGAVEVAAALAEMSRVTRTGGCVVLLAPELPRPAIPAALRLRKELPVRLAGGKETIWVFRRA